MLSVHVAVEEVLFCEIWIHPYICLTCLTREHLGHCRRIFGLCLGYSRLFLMGVGLGVLPGIRYREGSI